MKKILIAVPTKDRPNMVKEVLEYELPYYNKFNIDLCYVDSSETDATRKIIEYEIEKYEKRIIYIKKTSEMCLDYKLVEMLRDFKYMGYDYYWLINDSISISEEMLRYITEITEKEFDLIRLPLSGSGDIDDFVTDDINEWFQSCSASMAHMATTIMSKSLLDSQTDWEGLRKKYVYNNTLDENHGYFFTVGFYLEQIAKLDKFRGIFIGNRFKWRRDCPLKHDISYWSKKVFETWAKSYPETILKLPDVYINKEQVIRMSDNIRLGRFSKEMLIHYRLNGLYSLEVYEKYKVYLKYITEEDEDTCKAIAETSLDELKLKYSNLVTLEADWGKKLNKIEKIINNRNIYLYGAGLYGERVLRKLCEDGFGEKVKGILVTKSDDNMEFILGRKVMAIDKVKIGSNFMIILCALPGTASSMKTELQQRGISEYIGLFDL